MVRKISDKGGIYEEPPYTEAEEAELYRRMDGCVGVLKSDHRPPVAPASAPQPHPHKSPRLG